MCAVIFMSIASYIRSEDENQMSADTMPPELIVHSPKNGHQIFVELHGWESLRVDVNVTISNFRSRDGSLALYIGNGEYLLMERWQPLNGNSIIPCEIPFPAKDDFQNLLEFLANGNIMNYSLEFALLDGGL